MHLLVRYRSRLRPVSGGRKSLVFWKPMIPPSFNRKPKASERRRIYPASNTLAFGFWLNEG